MKNIMCRSTFQIAALLLVLAMALSGCATIGNEQATGSLGGPLTDQQKEVTGRQGPSAAARGTQGNRALQGASLNKPAGLLSKRVIHFDFDSSIVKPKYMPILEAHGEYLATHPEAKVVIEGHTDERGSREYNLALGARRAQAVEQILLFNGATPEQVSTVSYGEQMPVDPRHTEAAWAKNRRAVIVYRRAAPGQNLSN